jgi:hypothetical protein
VIYDGSSASACFAVPLSLLEGTRHSCGTDKHAMAAFAISF